MVHYTDSKDDGGKISLSVLPTTRSVYKYLEITLILNSINNIKIQ